MIHPKGETPDSLMFATEGVLTLTEDGYTIEYDEPAEAELGNSKTSIAVSNGLITMCRVGDVNSTMVFEKNKWHVSDYETAYGTFDMHIKGLDVISLIDTESQGKILIRYDLKITGLIESYNELSIVFT